MDTALLLLLMLFLSVGLIARKFTKVTGLLLIVMILAVLCYMYLT
jgi:hypothetical protein